jgi:mannose/fructose-specific phosphotransferase system component IIA
LQLYPSSFLAIIVFHGTFAQYLLDSCDM